MASGESREGGGGGDEKRNLARRVVGVKKRSDQKEDE